MNIKTKEYYIDKINEYVDMVIVTTGVVALFSIFIIIFT